MNKQSNPTGPWLWAERLVSPQYLACLSTSSSKDKLAFDVGLQEHSKGESRGGFDTIVFVIVLSGILSRWMESIGAHTYIFAYSWTFTYTKRQKPSYIYLHTCRHSHTQTSTHKHRHIHHTFTHLHTHTLSCTHLLIHNYKHTHSQTIHLFFHLQLFFTKSIHPHITMTYNNTVSAPQKE